MRKFMNNLELFILHKRGGGWGEDAGWSMVPRRSTVLYL